MSARVTCRTVLKAGISGIAALTLVGPLALAEAWPSKPIKLICAYPAGGLADIFARVYGEYLSQKLGQPIVMENRAGANGTIAAQAVKASPSDGYTLMVGVTVTLAQNRVLLKSLPYDPDKDFVLISSMSGGHVFWLRARRLELAV